MLKRVTLTNRRERALQDGLGRGTIAPVRKQLARA